MLESAFARISLALPTKLLSEDINSPQCNESNSSSSNKLKRALEDNESPVPTKKLNSRVEIDENRKSPVLKSSLVSKRRLFDSSMTSSNSSSPLFYGFENSLYKHNTHEEDTVDGIEVEDNEDIEKKLVQEKADLEYAKRLQEELNRTVHNTRGSERRQSNFRLHKRQTTLDELMNNSYRVK